MKIEDVEKACVIKKKIGGLEKKEKALGEVQQIGIAPATGTGYFVNTSPLHVFKETSPVIDVVKTMLFKELRAEKAALLAELEDL